MSGEGHQREEQEHQAMDNGAGDRARVEASDELDIAVIGMAGRFPGAPDVDAFWANLRAGVESIRSLSEQELLDAGVDPDDLADPAYVRAAPVLDDFDRFDAAFFDISPADARLMDPQRRLLLECGWQALEDAGTDPGRYPGAIGIYAGVGLNGYAIHNLFTNRGVVRSAGELALLLNGDKDYAATQVSYKLNLTGPSINVQTACSTSLVAVHLARQALLAGDCDMALAGGSSVIVPHLAGYRYEEGSILSPDGHCRAFDADARGTVFGSGCGLVVLKRLDDAIRDGDTVRAVIKGTAVNNDGSLKVGFTAPSVDGQAAVVAQALAAAGVSPRDIGFVEAHGTGTPLGDPIEVEALTRAFRTGTPDVGFCALGSLKPNIGHLNTAAGAAGLIKAILALQHREIPPTINVSTLNPRIDFATSPFRVVTRLEPWPAGATPRRAGVSSLGIGGTNAHVVIEEAPRTAGPAVSSAQAQAQAPRRTLVLSARTQDALTSARERLGAHLAERPDLSIDDVAHTLWAGRAGLGERLALRAATTAEAAAILRGEGPSMPFEGATHGRRPVVFLFPGQGAQAVGMGRELHASLPVFREELDLRLDQLRRLVGVDVPRLLFATGEDAVAAGEALAQTRLTQPVLFAIELALTRQLEAWGLRPDVLLGHSVGELVAACVAGVFSADDALRLVVERGRLMQSQPPGSMLSVALPAAQLESDLAPSLTVAALNAPDLCVVSGPAMAIDALRARLDADGVGNRPLRTSHAFHSALMDGAVAPFSAAVAAVPRHLPAVRVISNLTGDWLQDEAAIDPAYWGRQLRAPVHFGPGIETVLRAEPDAVFLEVGPGRALGTFVRQHRRESLAVAAMGATDRGPGELEQLREAAARLWTAGAAISVVAADGRAGGRRVPLPTYPFQRERHWVSPGDTADPGARDRDGVLGAGDLPGAIAGRKRPDIADWFSVPSWRRILPPVPATPGTAVPPRTWLVLADDPVVDAVATRLAEAGDAVVRVAVGAAFHRDGDRSWTLDPAAPAGYNALVGDLLASGLVPDHVIAGWTLGVEVAPDQAPDIASFRAFQARSFYPVLHLVRALGRHNITMPITITSLTAGLHDITGAEPLRPEPGTLVGQAKVIQQEYHNVSCRLIDLDPAAMPRPEVLVGSLVAELAVVDHDMVVAFRGPHRWVQTYEPIRVEAAPPAPIREGGLLLVSGGLVGIGLALAEHIADTWRTPLLFIEDASMPPRDRWDRWLAENDPQHIVSLRVRAAQVLMDHGVALEVVGCGLDQPASIASAIQAAERRHGPLRGVIHAAAGSSAGRINTITDSGAAECERNLVAVAHGLLAIDSVTADRDLDLRLALGSLGSVLGGVGYVSFGAASAFMATFAQWSGRRAGRDWQVQSWDSWRLEWTLDERIMTLIRDNLVERIMPTAITREEGLACFGRLFGVHAPQVAISATDLQARYRTWVQLATVRGPREEAPPEAKARPALARSYVAPRNPTEEAIAAVWQEMLGIEPIGVYDNFYDLGGHSLLATQVVSRLRKVLETDVSLAAMFEDPTINGLANVVFARRTVAGLLSAHETRAVGESRAAGATEPSSE